MRDIIYVGVISMTFAVAYLALTHHPSSGHRPMFYGSGYETSGNDPGKTYDI